MKECVKGGHAILKITAPTRQVVSEVMVEVELGPAETKRRMRDDGEIYREKRTCGKALKHLCSQHDICPDKRHGLLGGALAA